MLLEERPLNVPQLESLMGRHERLRAAPSVPDLAPGARGRRWDQKGHRIGTASAAAHVTGYLIPKLDKSPQNG